MNIDKKFLMDLIKHDKSEYEYLFNLYKVYELCRKITGGHIKRNRDLLDEIEDKIYTVNGKILSDEERIGLEVKRIYKACGNIKNVKLKNYIIAELKKAIMKIKFNFDDKEYSDDVISDQNQLYSMAKSSLSLLQAKLNLPISFLYDASTIFMDLYECEYMNSKQFFGDLMNYIEQEDLYNGKTIYYNEHITKNGGK